jgi:hypothetical protein
VGLARRIQKGDVPGGVGVIRFGPSDADNLSAEFRKTCGRSAKDIMVGGPTPEKDMFSSLFNCFQILRGYEYDFLVDSSLWSEHKVIIFRPWQVVKIESLFWAASPDRYIRLSDSHFCWRSAAIGYAKEKIEALQFIPFRDLRDGTYARMRDKSSLRHYGSLISLITNPPEQATKYHKHEGENGRPGSRSAEKVFVQKILKHTLLLDIFVLAALSYGCCVICIWHGLEFSKFRFLFLAGLFFTLEWCATKTHGGRNHWADLLALKCRWVL